MKKPQETPDQNRIRRAFADFPCSGTTNPRLVTMSYDEITFAQIAGNLEALAISVKAYILQLEQRDRERNAMEEELRMTGNLLTRIRQLTEKSQ